MIETLEQPPPYQQNENQTINGNDVIGNSKNGKWKKGKVISQYIYFQALTRQQLPILMKKRETFQALKVTLISLISYTVYDIQSFL